MGKREHQELQFLYYSWLFIFYFIFWRQSTLYASAILKGISRELWTQSTPCVFTSTETSGDTMSSVEFAETVNEIKNLKDLFPWTQKVPVRRTNINALSLAQKAAGTGERRIWCLAHSYLLSLAAPPVLKGRACNFSAWLQALLSLDPGLYLQCHLLPLDPQMCFTRLHTKDHSYFSDYFILPF